MVILNWNPRKQSIFYTRTESIIIFFHQKNNSCHVSTTSKPSRFEQWAIGVYKSTPFSRTIIVQSCDPAKWPSISTPLSFISLFILYSRFLFVLRSRILRTMVLATPGNKFEEGLLQSAFCTLTKNYARW